MSTRIEILKEAIAANQQAIAQIATAERALRVRRDEITKVISDVLEKLEPVPEKLSDEEEEEMDELCDLIGDFAYEMGMTWSGGEYSYDWTPGQRIEFWVPSTC